MSSFLDSISKTLADSTAFLNSFDVENSWRSFGIFRLGSISIHFGSFLASSVSEMMDPQAFFGMLFQLYHAVCLFHLRFQQTYQNYPMLYQVSIID